jgi:membrane-bound lytic murein transglycosylase F
MLPFFEERYSNLKRLHSLLMVPIIGLLLLGTSCEFDWSSFKSDAPVLNRIIRKGELTVITRNNAHCYYSYRDQEMGFEHDLAKAFASYLGVSLTIRIADRWEGMIPSLKDDTGDLIAASMTITPKRNRQVLFSNGYMNIQQHLIIHRGNHAIRTIEDLAGRTIHVRRGTSYQERLENLANRIPDLSIVLHENVPTEELIRRVAEKEIDITVADSNIALLNRRYHPQAVLGPPLGKKEQLGWAVKPEATALRAKIDQFFKHIQENGVYGDLFRQYYAEVERFDYVDMKIYHRRLATRLPKYQPILMAAAREFDFDWRLIAAQMYQESHFRRYARSHAGAYGLMQLTKRTAKSFGVTDITDPEQNIYAGVRHLRSLFDYYDIQNDSDRQSIALAAYNIGQGHVSDAQKLAISMRLDPNKWSSLEKTLPLLRQQKYYKNATYGYCEGLEPITYVKQIRIYYDILKRQAIDYNEKY